MRRVFSLVPRILNPCKKFFNRAFFPHLKGYQRKNPKSFKTPLQNGFFPFFPNFFLNFPPPLPQVVKKGSVWFCKFSLKFPGGKKNLSPQEGFFGFPNPPRERGTRGFFGGWGWFFGARGGLLGFSKTKNTQNQWLGFPQQPPPTLAQQNFKRRQQQGKIQSGRRVKVPLRKAHPALLGVTQGGQIDKPPILGQKKGP